MLNQLRFRESIVGGVRFVLVVAILAFEHNTSWAQGSPPAVPPAAEMPAPYAISAPSFGTIAPYLGLD